DVVGRGVLGDGGGAERGYAVPVEAGDLVACEVYPGHEGGLLVVVVDARRPSDDHGVRAGHYAVQLGVVGDGGPERVVEEVVGIDVTEDGAGEHLGAAGCRPLGCDDGAD